MNIKQHTPTPWEIRGKAGYPSERATAIDGMVPFAGFGINGADKKSVAALIGRTVTERQLNAEFIVRACNAHDELVAALSTMLGAAETDCMDDKSNVWRSAMIDARAALAKTGG